MKLQTLLLLSLLYLLSACSTTSHHSDPYIWPDNIPPRQYFVDYYHNSSVVEIQSESDYLLWVRRFYFGWELYKKGWLKATKELVKTLKTTDGQIVAREKALAIGRLVSAEWAQNAKYRVINTRHLNIWGNALNESITNKEQLLMLDRILEDVKALLGGVVQPKDIAYTRYYEIDTFEVDFQ